MKREIIYAYMFLVLVAALTVGSTSFGMGSNIVCKAYDDSREGHGAHNSCGECLAKHGGCHQTCNEISYVCMAKGIGQNGDAVEIKASGANRYATADAALRRCQILGATNCQTSTYSDCAEDLQPISRNRCQRTAMINDEVQKIGSESYLFARRISQDAAPTSTSRENSGHEMFP